MGHAKFILSTSIAEIQERKQNYTGEPYLAKNKFYMKSLFFLESNQKQTQRLAAWNYHITLQFSIHETC